MLQSLSFLLSLLTAAFVTTAAFAKSSSPECEALLQDIRAVSAEMGYSGWELERTLAGGIHPLPPSVKLEPGKEPGYYRWWVQQMDSVLESPTEYYQTLALNYLRALAAQGETASDDATKGLLRNSPMWANSPHALGIAVLLYQVSANPLDVLALQERLPIEYHRTFREQATRTIQRRWGTSVETAFALQHENEYLRLMSVTPDDWIPQPVRQLFRQTWQDEDAYPAVRMDAIQPLPAGMQHAGACVEMSRGHLGTLGLSCFKDHGKGETVLVRVQGELIGALKYSGDMSMIALRNVRDSRGRLVLVMGGVYQIEKGVALRVEDLQNVHQLPGTGGLSVTDLSQLRVKSNSFMLNHVAWTEDMRGELASIVGNSMDFTIQDRRAHPDERALLHPPLWRSFLKALDQRRRELQALLPPTHE